MSHRGKEGDEERKDEEKKTNHLEIKKETGENRRRARTCLMGLKR